MRVHTAIAEIKMVLRESRSLKDKRRVLKSLITKIKNQFNVSIAEIDFLDAWQYAGIGLACVANSSIQARKQLDKILEYMEEDVRIEMVNIHKEVF